MKRTPLSWSSLFLLTFLAAYLYLFNEWLFAITKPSYLNDLDFPHQLQILFSLSALLAGVCFLGLLPLVLLGQIPLLKRNADLLIQLGAWLPAGIFAALILLMMDNFTYTVFKFGIVSTDGWSRGLYGVGFLVLVILCYRRTLKALASLSQKTMAGGGSQKLATRLLAGVFLLSVAFLVLPERTRASSLSTNATLAAEVRPHILLITSDGVNATHLSVYGYARDTTPFLRQLADSSLVAENAFSNAGNTTASVISLYTGKYPTQTRVLFPPDILEGEDAYQHLPGILRAQGYKTVQITLPFYLDANDLNLLDGFEVVKANSAIHSKYLTKIGKFLPYDKALFTDDMINRIVDRMRHIYFIEKMENPYLLVTTTSGQSVDNERIEILKQEIRSATQPVFIHTHLMVSHGAKTKTIEQKFSAGKPIEKQERWDADFYDDSILDFDKNIATVVNTLEARGLLENTILFIGSDHGQKWDQLQRVPFILRFPHGQYAGRIQENVQNLDIAPTLLDYLGIDQPDWMPGKSLISGQLGQRPILGVSPIKDETDPDGNFKVNRQRATSQFHQFGSISLIYCQKWFRLDLYRQVWESGDVDGSTAACPAESQTTDEQALQWIVERLRQDGFDVSSLNGFTP